MAGKSVYDRRKDENVKDFKKQKVAIKYEDVEKKIGKMSLSATELAIYLAKCKGLPEEGITEKTVKNYIKAICDESGGVLSISEFKHDPSKRGSKYEFKPEYHGLLLTLLNTDYFDGRKNERRLSTRNTLCEQLISNIDKYLSNNDEKNIKEHPAYVNAVLERHLSKHINNELTVLLRTIYHSDPVIRYQLMVELLSALFSMRKWMMKVDSKMISTKMVYAHELNELEDAKYQKGIFEAVNLDEFIIKFMALRMHGGTYKNISDNEKLTPVAMRLAQSLYNITVRDDADIKRILDQIDEQISNSKRYKEIMGKAEKILDLEDPQEAQIYYDLQERCKIQYLRPGVCLEDYKKTVKFTESCIADDKWDIINKFAQLGRQAMNKEQMDKIMAIKDRTSNH